MEIALKVTGMMCQHCVAHVTKALEGVEGVSKVEVSDAIVGDVSVARFEDGGRMYLTFSVSTDDGISFWRADEGKLIRLSNKPGIAFAKDEYSLKPIAKELPVSAE